MSTHAQLTDRLRRRGADADEPVLSVPSDEVLRYDLGSHLSFRRDQRLAGREGELGVVGDGPDPQSRSWAWRSTLVRERERIRQRPSQQTTAQPVGRDDPALMIPS